jgi:hypothetical protein
MKVINSVLPDGKKISPAPGKALKPDVGKQSIKKELFKLIDAKALSEDDINKILSAFNSKFGTEISRTDTIKLNTTMDDTNQ